MNIASKKGSKNHRGLSQNHEKKTPCRERARKRTGKMTLRIAPRLMEMGPFSGQNLKNIAKNLIENHLKIDVEKIRKMTPKGIQKGAKRHPKTFKNRCRKSMWKNIRKTSKNPCFRRYQIMLNLCKGHQKTRFCISQRGPDKYAKKREK